MPWALEIDSSQGSSQRLELMFGHDGMDEGCWPLNQVWPSGSRMGLNRRLIGGMLLLIWQLAVSGANMGEGLIAYWPLDTLHAGLTPDAVGSHDLKASNLTQESVVLGRHDRAFSFRSDQQTLLWRVHEPGQALPINQYPSFSLSMWVKVQGRGQHDLRLFSEGNTLDSNPLFNLGTHSGGIDDRLDVYIRQSGWPTFGHAYSNQQPLDGQWHHLAWVQQEGARRLYVDGKLDTMVLDPQPPGPWRLDNTSLGGILRSQPSHWMTGQLDDVALWRRPLAEQEILELAQYSVGDLLGEGSRTDSLSLSNYLVPRTQNPGTAVASILVEGVDASASWTPTLSIGQGDDHNGLFIIQAQELILNTPLNLFSEGKLLSVRLSMASPEGISIQRSFTIMVIGENALSDSVRIQEFMADNQGNHLDGDGRPTDWVELYNPLSVPVALDGYYLSDDPDNLSKWPLPSIQLGAGEFLLLYGGAPIVDGVVQTDYRDAAGYYHLGFNLNADGEFLGLLLPDGRLIGFDPREGYPPQQENVSYGLDASGLWSFQSRPTPGATNLGGIQGWVGDTTFSVDRGFFDAPFEVVLSTSSGEGATIHYTLDGSLPSPSHGLVYESPLLIDTTTTLRAMAFRDGWEPTNVDTQTYLFVDQVARQPADPPGWPTNWGRNDEVNRQDGAGNGIVPADYEMDPRVVDATLPGYGVREALLDIPSISIVMDQDAFIEPGRGIYALPQSRIEASCSVELLHPDGRRGFQEDCKIEVHGNSSRRPWRMQKHSLRLTFSGEVGVRSLDYPLFEDSHVTRFNQLVLRACFTDSWGLVSWGSSRYRPNDSQYIRDVWMKQSLQDMGQPSSHGRFVHLYVNGLYFGLHDLTERLGADFFADHLGGAPEDWEINADFSSPGPRWNQMRSLDASSDQGLTQLSDYVDLTNLADYFILHFYADAEDWPHHNGYAAANPISGDGRYRFFVWDQEIVLDKFTWNRYDRSDGVGALFQQCRANEDFRRLFADRVHKHLMQGGALSLEASQERYERLAHEIDKAIVAESARWGDTQASTPYGNAVEQPRPLDALDHDNFPPAPHAPNVFFTREDAWLVEKDNVVSHYLPTLHDASSSHGFLRELRAAQLYPSIDAPSFSLKPGPVHVGDQLAMQASSGIIYYSLDGSDPWQPAPLEERIMIEDGAEVWAWVAEDDRYGLAWTQAGFLMDEDWISGRTGVGYEVSPSDYKGFVGLDVGHMRLAQPGVYSRVAFNIDDSSWLESQVSLNLFMRYDDGFVAYLNGHEVARANAPLGSVAWNALARASHDDGAASQFERFDISEHHDKLLEGLNWLTIHGLNVSLTSSDFLMTPKLVASRMDSLVIPQELAHYEQPLVLDHPVHLKARAFHQGQWSALAEATYTPGGLPQPGSLVISELHYHPSDAEQPEFIELLNVSQQSLVMDGLRFTQGVAFTFPAATVLPPGKRLVLMATPLTGEALPPAVMVMGPFEDGSRLSNGGERITLSDAAGVTLLSLEYGDQSPWPEEADGGGHSLVLRDPFNTGDLSDPQAWVASLKPGGSPGMMDWAESGSVQAADEDGDGIPALGEPFHGTSDQVRQQPGEVFWILRDHPVDSVPGSDASLVLQIMHDPTSQRFEIGVEISHDLGDWETLVESVQSYPSLPSEDGREIISVPLPDGEAGHVQRFFRLVYELTP